MNATVGALWVGECSSAAMDFGVTAGTDDKDQHCGSGYVRAPWNGSRDLLLCQGGAW